MTTNTKPAITSERSRSCLVGPACSLTGPV
jgi:hypothetical protein